MIKLPKTLTWKTIALGLGFASLGTWLVRLYLFFYYIDTNPPICQPGLGKIYPLNNHGQIVYVDFAEKWTLNGLYMLALLFFGTGFLIYKWKRIRDD